VVLDAKWRSGRSNVLEAMESAHIHHDALRRNRAAPSPPLLLFAGPPLVPSLGTNAYIACRGLGAISDVSVGRSGVGELAVKLQ